MRAATMVRSVLFNLAFYLVMIVALVVCLPALLLPRGVAWVLTGLFARTMIGLHRVIAGVRLEIRGRGNVPPGGCLIAAKHQSMWETIALLPVFDRPAVILKRELLMIPLFGWFAAKLGMIPVARGQGTAALRDLTARTHLALAEGRPVIIFPEGTRREPGAPPQYKQGVAFLYRDLGVPCVPLALNSGLFWPRRAFVRHPGRLIVDILPPIPPGLPIRPFLARLVGEIEPAADRLIVEAAADPNLPLPPAARAKLVARARVGTEP